MSTLSRLRTKTFPVSDIRLTLLVSIVAFLILRSVHLVIHFQAFGIPSVVGATAMFLAAALAWLWFAARNSDFRFERPTNHWTWPISAGLTLFWWLASAPFTSSFMRVYAPEFPAQTIDAGSGVAVDTFFHSSLIYSIMNIGYPSTGLDGTPVTPYHVLSHYADAGVLNITGLTPLDSAGFLLQLKIMLFVSAVLTLLWMQLRAMPSWVQWAAPVLLVPAFSGTWHVVGSHGLWFTTLLVIIAAPFVFATISSESSPTGRALVALGLLGMALSVGKISTGFMFMFIVGLMLWLRNMRDRRVYLLGAVWGAFMLGYASWIASDRPDAAAASFTLFKRVWGIVRLLALRDSSSSIMLGLYGVLALFLVVALLRPTAFHRRLLGVSLGGTAILIGIAFARMDKNDRWYFAQALFFILLTLSIGLVAKFAKDTDLVKLWKTGRKAPMRTVVVATVLILVGFAGTRTSFNVINPNPLIIGPSLSTAFTPAVQPPASATGIEAFDAALTEFMKTKQLTAHNSQVFIAREVWKDVEANPKVTSDPENLWPLPLLVYAKTGVPLYKGVVATHESYGFSAYGPESITPTRAEFESAKKCGDKAIIDVTSWSPATFTLACEAKR